MNAHLQRGLLLYQQSRPEPAEAELRQALALEPQDALAHALLALCLAARKQFAHATAEAQQAIHFAPDLAFAHYALAHVASDRNQYPEALAAIQEAIRLDASEVDYYALLSAIHFDERRWPAALQAAEQGLALDAEHVGCTNLRAMALVKLGRQTEAGAAIGAALSRNPDNALTHANQGWTLLEQGEPQRALEHFREALRLDPENEWARAGIVEALKARHLLYAVMLKYFLWMSKLSTRAQWGIILGGYFGNRLLGAMAESNPSLGPWVLPLRILYITFAVLTWTASPMFNLLLRLNRFGRLALTPAQNVEADWMGLCLLPAVLSLAGCVAMGFNSPWVMSLAVFGLLLLPLAGYFRCAAGWPRKTMLAALLVLLLLGLAAIALIWEAYLGSNRNIKATVNRAFAFLSLFALGVLASTLLANILATQRPRR